ncbi:MAG: asparagine synthase-related protein [Thermoanaerobaculia bacterium]|nr:asparagine synthase-related protein [Thermoanaerobaculia bacterium]
MRNQPVTDLVDLVSPTRQQLLGVGLESARKLLLSDDPRAVRRIGGSFALVARDGERVRLARSLDRPLRFFLAKQPEGPLLIVAESIAEIRQHLEELGFADQFHPSYTRMVPAHHVTTVRLVGCPDPDPRHERFLEPPTRPLPADTGHIGRLYVEALYRELDAWVAANDPREPIGVLFSGGVDSGAVLLTLYRVLLDRGQSPARLKAFTLTVGGGDDLRQAREFLGRVDLELLHEIVEVEPREIDPLAAVELIEDYKPLDVECAAVNLALLRAIRARYPDWRPLADGDGGDENLKDYPIEENPELTIRSVVGNPLLYQEGWGVGCLKHSLTYSGGLSRGCVRGFAPRRALGFEGISPFTRPALVELATAIPFDRLARGDHQRLYALKGEILGRGLRQVLDVELPVFEKRRFQRGAVAAPVFPRLFGHDGELYRRHFLESSRAGRSAAPTA